MSQKYARLLNNQDLVEHFLTKVLDFDYSKLGDIIYSIVKAERELVDLDVHSQTLNRTDFRDRNYRDEKVRWELRKQIIEELITCKRPEDDDNVKLGPEGGGMLPLTDLKCEKQAFIIIGLPASGKSGISNNVADQNGCLMLDSDFAKRKLPEFRKFNGGATIVHEESSKIVQGFSDNPYGLVSVVETSWANGYNLVIPKIGQQPSGIISLAKVLKSFGYSVHLTLINLFKREATIRAIHRFYKTDRYVPLGLIFDGYGNDPCLTYYLVKDKCKDLFASFGAISTNVPVGENPFSVDISERNPAELYEFRENFII